MIGTLIPKGAGGGLLAPAPPGGVLKVGTEIANDWERLSFVWAGRFGITPERARDVIEGIRKIYDPVRMRVRKPAAQRCEVTGDVKIIFALDSDSVETIVERWARTFPEWAEEFRQQYASYKSSLVRDNGMSKGGTMRLEGMIPMGIRVLLTQWVDPLYWQDRKNVRRFYQAFPFFATVRPRGRA